MSIKKLMAFVSAAAFVVVAGPAQADIKIGVVLALTGPNASLGVPYRKGVELLPKEIGGEKIQLIFLDDASDPSTAVRNAQKLISDDKVDILIGGSNTPASQAMANITTREQIQQVALAPAAHPADKNQWLISMPQPANLWAAALVKDMVRRKVKTVAYIGFSDPWGDIAYNGLKEAAEKAGIQVVTNERYARADTSVTGQVLKIIAAKPDAVLVGGSGTPGALPHIALAERNYKGPVYATPGVFNKDFLRVGGKSVEDVIGVTGPIGAHEQLPAGNPIKKVSEEFIKKYEDINGKGSWNSFAAFAYDGMLTLEDAIPRALKKAKPGTPEFRKAVRDEVRAVKELAGTNGVYQFPEGSSYGVDERSVILVQVKNGDWKLISN
ncbi:ABC transporter substrate-binding protein [Pseudorhodoplanes sinuspersici]|uniref:Branched-chain amino acid ABC transporter substrate-binding protein n=1 Tax=Pseudorhodoplanes sinuspersici TaxID=1235591 RepID=A0A1W6ZS87_9HYPH|nr:ABC transporter substrate-binding protein [Pseudorhodoplanes sinuspersici]ARQ00222.1 branched-chain amino acid ABC transporter substrate-binding protein [Pseudorhodoplanes sinuspersici]RKE67632.1 amino acid/amide ABC transporter substrate-binding protein (HAAT family) [Pseudorhodoplanes sinuspersici]